MVKLITNTPKGINIEVWTKDSTITISKVLASPMLHAGDTALEHCLHYFTLRHLGGEEPAPSALLLHHLGIDIGLHIATPIS